MEEILIVILSLIVGFLAGRLSNKPGKNDGEFIIKRQSEEELFTILQLECGPESLLKKDKLILKIVKK